MAKINFGFQKSGHLSRFGFISRRAGPGIDHYSDMNSVSADLLNKIFLRIDTDNYMNLI